MDFLTLLEKLNEQFQHSGLKMQNSLNATNNIFNILNIQYNEVLVCRFLGYLLNPTSGHGYGYAPLKSFIEALGISTGFTENDYKTAVVELEDRTNANRRVDIAIYIANEVIPIEVKIYAKDQETQLFDYYNFYNKVQRTKAHKIYYLTPNGKEPSKDSLFSRDKKKCLKSGEYENISFEKTIQMWLNNLPSQNDPNNLIMQFKEVITTMCKEYEDRIELMKLLSLNPDNEQPTEYLELLSVILSNSDLIWENARNQYLKNTIKLETLANKYILTDCDEQEKKDEHCILTLKRISDNVTVAWICVDTNLYVVIDHKVTKWKQGTDRENYFWRYLYLKGSNEPLPLKNPNANISIHDEIKLDEIISPEILN
ncbi:MAG: PD-(D/E)XK nuclease family protein [Oscillospiraceae bacterium]|nr:PD-(D/E)XK nuclease family protein [Oscillospiraceae bacterium]